VAVPAVDGAGAAGSVTGNPDAFAGAASRSAVAAWVAAALSLRGAADCSVTIVSRSVRVASCNASTPTSTVAAAANGTRQRERAVGAGMPASRGRAPTSRAACARTLSRTCAGGASSCAALAES
jgi:hypothetical protein